MSGPVSASPSESVEHLQLKRLALLWAQANGFRIAAVEVSLPFLRFRLDVAAYRPERTQQTRFSQKLGKARRVSVPTLGVSVVFECKASRPDYLRDAGSTAAMTEVLKRLTDAKLRHEQMLKVHYPSIRNGDTLFPEFETLNFERPGYEAYQGVLEEIRRVSARLHQNTKFEQLLQRRIANLHYLVSEPNLFQAHELPAGWGVLQRENQGLVCKVLPIFQEVEAEHRLEFLHRIALSATRVVNAAQGIAYSDFSSGSSMAPKG